MNAEIHYNTILQLIESGATVLDLGCGDGTLLALLKSKRQIRGYGIDIEFTNIVACVDRGIDAYQGDIVGSLHGFSDQSYDYVILSQTLQEIRDPALVIREMLRIGKRVIISFPNFANWRIRLQLLMGKTPNTAATPFPWYATPNIRFTTFRNVLELCNDQMVHVASLHPLTADRWIPNRVLNRFPNTCAQWGMLVLEPLT